MKFFIMTTLAIALSGCQVLQKNLGLMAYSQNISDVTYLCETDGAQQTFEAFCQLHTWSEYLIDADQITWTERSNRIKVLGSGPEPTLQKILLSQGVETPYTNRLRAQKWVSDLKPSMDAKMAQVLTIMIEKPSQQMLELESAISILSKVNARQEKSIADLQEILNIRTEQIQIQRDQVEQLLKIEANMSDQKRNQ